MDVFEYFLCTGVIFVSFIKDGNVDCAIESFRLVKIKPTNKSELFLISLGGISESCVALYTWRFLISFKIIFFNEWATEFRISTPFLDCNNSRVVLVFNDSFNHGVLYTLTNWIYLIVLWNFRIFNNVREDVI